MQAEKRRQRPSRRACWEALGPTAQLAPSGAATLMLLTHLTVEDSLESPQDDKRPLAAQWWPPCPGSWAGQAGSSGLAEDDQVRVEAMLLHLDRLVWEVSLSPTSCRMFSCPVLRSLCSSPRAQIASRLVTP